MFFAWGHGLNRGDHIRNRKVSGSTYQVVGKTRTHLQVRDLESGTPGLIDRDELDRWKVVWSPKGDGLDGLVKRGRFWVRVDAHRASRLTVLVALCVALFAVPVQAEIKGHPQYRQWAAESHMPFPPKVFARNRECPFVTAPAGKIAGCAQGRTVWVPLGYPISRGMFFHEIGHVVHRTQLPFWPLEPEVFANRFAGCAMTGGLGWCDRIVSFVRRKPARHWVGSVKQVRRGWW